MTYDDIFTDYWKRVKVKDESKNLPILRASDNLEIMRDSIAH